jgi:hypothetical protein
MGHFLPNRPRHLVSHCLILVSHGMYHDLRPSRSLLLAQYREPWMGERTVEWGQKAFQLPFSYSTNALARIVLHVAVVIMTCRIGDGRFFSRKWRKRSAVGIRNVVWQPCRKWVWPSNRH